MGWINLTVYKNTDNSHGRLKDTLKYLKAEDGMKLSDSSRLIPYNFDKVTEDTDINIILKEWRRILANGIQQKHKGPTLKRYAYQLILNSGNAHDEYESFKANIFKMLDAHFYKSRALAFFHFDTSYVHCHLLLHPVCRDGSALRISMQSVKKLKEFSDTFTVAPGGKRSRPSVKPKPRNPDEDKPKETAVKKTTPAEEKEKEEDAEISTLIKKVGAITGLQGIIRKNS